MKMRMQHGKDGEAVGTFAEARRYTDGQRTVAIIWKRVTTFAQPPGGGNCKNHLTVLHTAEGDTLAQIDAVVPASEERSVESTFAMIEFNKNLLETYKSRGMA